MKDVEPFVIDITKHSGLPIYEDGREFSVDYKDRQIFSLTELEEGRKVTLLDDKGRSTSFRVGPLSVINVTRGADKVRVPFRMIYDLTGDSIGDLEQVQTGLYIENGGLEAPMFPTRAPKQPSPAKSDGLRLVVNPWAVFPMAINRITVHEKNI